MGAGASSQGAGTAQKSTPKKAVRRPDMLDTKLGFETEVVLLAPPLAKAVVGEKYILRVAREAIVLCGVDERTSPLTYFKYQDILCWSHNPSTFSFKATGRCFGKPGGHVHVSFRTQFAKDICAANLKAATTLMADMETQAVSKENFETLIEVLTSADESVRCGWFETIKQFAVGRSFTVHQGVALLGLARSLGNAGDDGFNGFEQLELALFLWDHTLDRNSFQLILNVFEDKYDRENLLYRIRESKTNRESAALLLVHCPNPDAAPVVRT